MYDMFHDFTTDTHQWYRSVVLCFSSVPFLKDGCDVCRFPIMRQGSSLEWLVKDECENRSYLTVELLSMVLGRDVPVTQLLIHVTQQDLSSALDQKKSVDVVILDFTKAFDTVPHLRLLSKLKCYGINDQLLSWISSFLIGRSQKVVLEGITSTAVSSVFFMLCTSVYLRFCVPAYHFCTAHSTTILKSITSWGMYFTGRQRRN